MLGNGKPAQLDLGRMKTCVSGRRIKGIEDVGGDLLRVLADTCAFIVFRHGALDFPSKGGEREFTGQGIIVFAIDPLSVLAMAFEAKLLVNHRAGVVGGMKSQASEEQDRRAPSKAKGCEREEHGVGVRQQLAGQDNVDGVS